MRFEHGVRQRFAGLVFHLHDWQTCERSHPVIGDRVPTNCFQTVCHALSRFDEQHVCSVGRFISGRAQIGEAGRLETRTEHGR